MAKLRIGVLYDYWWDEDEERVEGERPRKKPPDDDVCAVYEALRKSGHSPVYVRVAGEGLRQIEQQVGMRARQLDQALRRAVDAHVDGTMAGLAQSFDAQDTNLA